MTNTPHIKGIHDLDLTVPGNGTHDVWIEGDQADIRLRISSSPGGAAEGGYESTSFHAQLPASQKFRFLIHPQDFLYEIGKIFGKEDVTTGYEDFDKEVMIQTNDPAKLRHLFSSVTVRALFQQLSGYSLAIRERENGLFLELDIQRAIVDQWQLVQLYNVFNHLLHGI